MVRLLPRTAAVLDPHGLGQIRQERILKLMNAPDFGAQLVRAFRSEGRSLPADIYDPWINRLYNYWQEESTDPFGDFTMATIVGYSQTEELFPVLLKAYLLSPEIPLDGIADKLQLSLEEVEGFHALFFNVRPRMQEPMFIANLLYPDGRQPEFQENYMEVANWELILLRSAFHNDFSAFFYLMGMQRRAKSYDTASALELVESVIMNNALLTADHLGAMQQRKATGFMNAKNIISSAKAGGQDDANLVDDPALGDLNIGRTIQDELFQIQANGS